MLAALPLALAALVTPTAAPAFPLPPGLPAGVVVDDPPILPVDGVKAGMVGKGYTVFSSARGPEPFEAEILGVMYGYLGPGEDLIIAKLKGEQIERTGVIAGMSGSPVYVDGKLIGAVGYRFGAFTKDPIAGITPIERMLTARDRAPGRRRANAGKTASSLPMTAWGQAEPVAVPIAIGGVSPHVIDAFRDELARRGLGPVVASGGPSGATKRAPPVRLYAGGPIAGNLVEGDISMSAIGTVTWVKGDRFLAFGHPFLGDGESEMPIANAEIVTTVASEAGSWKMGQAQATVGTLSDDRLHAIAGSMGAPPPMVPVKVVVDVAGPRKDSDAKRALAFKVFQHETETPLFCAIAVANALANRVGVEKRGGTVDVDVKATLSTGDIVPFSFRAADTGTGFDLPVAFGLLAFLNGAVDQDFQEVSLADVDVRIRGRPDVDRARIVSVDATRALVAGKTGEVRVRLQPFRGPLVERRIAVRIPRGFAPGRYQLVVGGQMESGRIEREGGLVPLATSFTTYLEGLKSQPPPGSLSVYLLRDTDSLRLEGQALPGLPASLVGLVDGGGGLSGGTVETRAFRLSRILDDGVVWGESVAQVVVRNADEADEEG